MLLILGAFNFKSLEPKRIVSGTLSSEWKKNKCCSSSKQIKWNLMRDYNRISLHPE